MKPGNALDLSLTRARIQKISNKNNNYNSLTINRTGLARLRAVLNNASMISGVRAICTSKWQVVLFRSDFRCFKLKPVIIISERQNRDEQ